MSFRDIRKESRAKVSEIVNTNNPIVSIPFAQWGGKKFTCALLFFCVANLDTYYNLDFFTNANMLWKKDIFSSIQAKRPISAK